MQNSGIAAWSKYSHNIRKILIVQWANSSFKRIAKKLKMWFFCQKFTRIQWAAIREWLKKIRNMVLLSKVYNKLGSYRRMAITQKHVND